jgi:hypothetical protein
MCCSEHARERGRWRQARQRDTTYLVPNEATKKAPDKVRAELQMMLPTRTRPQPVSEYSQAFSDHDPENGLPPLVSSNVGRGRVTHIGPAIFCWLSRLPMPRIDAAPHRMMATHEVDAMAAMARAHIDELGA